MQYSHPSGQQVQIGRLVAVVRRSSSANMIVYFNGYGNRAFAKPEVPFSTRFESYATVTGYEAHAIWLVEEETTWFLEHEAQIMDLLTRYVDENRIRAIKLVGSSAGGYAAIRFGMLLDHALSRAGFGVTILSFAVNPQTGFRVALLDKAEDAVLKSDWPKDDLGTNPILLPSEYHERLASLTIDLIELADGYQPSDFGVVLMNDDLNPIERTFCDDILHWSFLLHLPKELGLPHAAGCTAIIRDHLWTAFNIALPFQKSSPASADLESLI